MSSAEGTAGNDILHGSADADSFRDSAGGDDEFYGEAGDDYLFASRSDVLGSVLLDGGAGRDRLTLSAYKPIDAILRGGDDADSIEVTGGAQVEIDGGSGDDLIQIAHEGTAYIITLGSGADRLVLTGVSWTWHPGPAIVITDFETGASGDRVVLDTFLTKLLNWDSYQNPFATGRLALEQRDDDTVLRIDRLGDGAAIDLIVFEGVDASSLTDFNLGFTPDGSITPGATFTGTGDADIVYGTGGADTFDGGAGNDEILGGAGNDVLNGGADWDRLDGQFGDDELNGGAGGDSLTDMAGGDDRMYGGDGSDAFMVSREGQQPASHILMDGGADNDSFHFNSSAVRRLDHLTLVGGTGNDDISIDGALVADIDAGEGNDLLYLTLIQTAYTITLGAGADRVSLGNYGFAAKWTGQLVFTDFETGAAGDRLEISTSLLRGKLETWGGISDPFAGGDLVLGQRGADAVLLFDRNGGADSFETLITFQNIAASSLTAFNLGDRMLPTVTPLVGTEGADSVSGGAGADLLFGFGGNDRLAGGGGNDRLVGMAGNDALIGDAGQDELVGGAGDDSYLVDSGDTLIELAGEGRDTVYATSSFTLTAGAEIELLTVYDRTTTNALTFTGNEFANTLYGNMGANGLIGGGGSDTLYGLGGDDAYIVDDASDVVVEFAGQGRDTVYTYGSYALSAGAEVEVLTAYDRAGTAAMNLTGSASSNLLYGNMGANALIGGGGSDTLYGLGGDDSYIVDDLSDLVVEVAGQGRDTVYALGSYALSASAEVEVLTVYNRAATDGVTLTGSATNNVVYGNMGANGLIGGGGSDTLYGLGGDDSYIVDDASDSVIELAGQGRDTVYALGDFTLAAGSEVEVVTAYDRGGMTALKLTGNALANTIIGNAGANVLDGKGGADTLYGMGGADSFQFSTALQPGTAPALIGDFATGVDKITLDDAVFGALAAGGLAASAFVAGSAAADADDRIVYNPATGALWYDADGTGAVAAIQFATLQGHPTLAAGDFWIV